MRITSESDPDSLPLPDPHSLSKWRDSGVLQKVGLQDGRSWVPKLLRRTEAPAPAKLHLALDLNT